ncbi:undecaprenyl/decaprenyl-phosphate alpha-N-acetylglucosaminyl 1-phosphate transferase [Candidatus Gottesmanbacteria bacterium]|nr:undecaprenyl/decaprenyl-phosphate alpha-N-acetylglucosaminyl 1-phosphate transferase [Candidatus Gottesmanbacteria bacterium]
MVIFFISFLFSFLISFFVTPLVIILAKRFKLVDDPKTRPHPAHTHKGVIPRGGGLSLFLGLFIPALLFIPFSKQFIGIFLAAFFIVLIGLWDDRKDRSPYTRFFLNFFVVAIVVLSGIGIPYITNPFGGIIRLDTLRIIFDFWGTHSIIVFADLFALLWIVWCMNMVNWSKGVDGQMPGFVAIASFVLGLLALKFSGEDASLIPVTILSFLTAGSFLGFLPWNFYPQKIMPGYGGGALAGFMLGVLSILSFGKLGTLLLVLAIPMTDALYTLSRRLIFRKSPFKADSGHLHHRLLLLGWGKRRIALFYWIISAIMGVIALFLSSTEKIFAIILVLASISAFIFWVSIFSSITKGVRDEEIEF